MCLWLNVLNCQCQKFKRWFKIDFHSFMQKAKCCCLYSRLPIVWLWGLPSRKTENTLFPFSSTLFSVLQSSRSRMCLLSGCGCSNLTAIYNASFQPKVWTDRFLSAQNTKSLMPLRLIRYSGRVCLCRDTLKRLHTFDVREESQTCFSFFIPTPFFNKRVSRWT